MKRSRSFDYNMTDMRMRCCMCTDSSLSMSENFPQR